MRSLVRARAYPTEALGASMWLGNAKKHLEQEIRAGWCYSNPHYDVFRCLSLCEAVAKIEELMVAIAVETNQRTGRKVFWV